MRRAKWVVGCAWLFALSLGCAEGAPPRPDPETRAEGVPLEEGPFFQVFLSEDGLLTRRSCSVDASGSVAWSQCKDRPGAPPILTPSVALVAYDAITFAENRARFLRETLLTEEGDVLEHRCPIDDQNRLVWSDCTGWQWGDPATTLRPPSIGDRVLRPGALGSVMIPMGAAVELRQRVADADGTHVFVRKCPSSTRGSYDWSRCDPWTETPNPLDAVPLHAQSTHRLGAEGTVALSVGGRTVVLESLVDANGIDAWYRYCPVAEDGTVSTDACSTAPFAGQPGYGYVDEQALGFRNKQGALALLVGHGAFSSAIPALGGP